MTLMASAADVPVRDVTEYGVDSGRKEIEGRKVRIDTGGAPVLPVS